MLCLAGAAPCVRLPAARVPRKPPLGRWRGLPCPPYADGLRGLWGLSPPDRLGKNRGSLRSRVNQIFGRQCPPPLLVDSPAFVNSPPKLPTANATKSGLLLRSAPPVRVFPTLILGTFATHKGRLFGFYPAERNKTQCYFVAFIVSNDMNPSGESSLPQWQRYLFRAVFPLAYGYQNRQRKW